MEDNHKTKYNPIFLVENWCEKLYASQKLRILYSHVFEFQWTLESTSGVKKWNNKSVLFW